MARAPRPEDLYDLRIPTDLDLSPDGRFVAFTRRSGDRSHVMIVRSSGGGLRRVPIGSRSAYLDSWTR